MLNANDFKKKQIIFLFTNEGDKLSFLNDNIIVKNKEGEIKYQSTCYRLFMICVVGNISITSGLIQRSKKFGFSICLMTTTFKMYEILGARKSINIGQCKENDFEVINNRWCLKYKSNPQYIQFLMNAILEYKDDIFLYIQQYYRFFMKRKSVSEIPVFIIH